ncbi:hypothetical protein CIB48_g6191 [Xylaria polymorpha]|nr:hypothetical protein CIB48_g6191 [Xylaria polymorpha]
MVLPEFDTSKCQSTADLVKECMAHFALGAAAWLYNEWNDYQGPTWPHTKSKFNYELVRQRNEPQSLPSRPGVATSFGEIRVTTVSITAVQATASASGFGEAQVGAAQQAHNPGERLAGAGELAARANESPRYSPADLARSTPNLITPYPGPLDKLAEVFAPSRGRLMRFAIDVVRLYAEGQAAGPGSMLLSDESSLSPSLPHLYHIRSRCCGWCTRPSTGRNTGEHSSIGIGKDGYRFWTRWRGKAETFFLGVLLG